MPLWLAAAPALTALAMAGEIASGRDGLLPTWVEALVLVALALVALPFLARAMRGRR
ncbi:MAG: hypothetical protein M3Q27_16615 [Actinomycetota bacterium]|nr:hypothetical protein [Actinomycetota bacterium]